MLGLALAGRVIPVPEDDGCRVIACGDMLLLKERLERLRVSGALDRRVVPRAIGVLVHQRSEHLFFLHRQQIGDFPHLSDRLFLPERVTNRSSKGQDASTSRIPGEVLVG